MSIAITVSLSSTLIINLPISNNVNITVNWGDGSSSQTFTTNYPSHTYTIAGNYVISVNGSFTTLGNYNNNRSAFKFLTNFNYITQIVSLTSFDNAFANISKNFTITIADNTITSNVTNMSYMFYNMSSMFGTNTSFNNPLTNLNTSNVTNMSYMFYNANQFNQLLNFDTSKVTNMSYMFYNSSASAFNQPLNFDTSKVTNMSNMLNNARSFNQPLNFNTSSVTNMSFMFSDLAIFNQLLNFDTSKVTDMNNMFYGARSYNQPVNFNTMAVTNMSGMFRFASGFNQSISFSDTSKVTNMSGMFSGANIFNTDISFNTSFVTNMSSMFNGALTFNKVLSFDTSNVIDMSLMFYNAFNFNKPLNFNTMAVTNMNSMFNGARAFNQPISFSDTSKVTNMSSMFYGASAINQPLSFNTSSVLYMGNMFDGTTAFDQDLSSWNISNLTNADVMFNNSGLSSSNYNKLLIGWGNQSTIKNSVSFGAIAIKYTTALAKTAHDILTNNYTWNITDGGYNEELYNPAYINTISNGTYHHVALTITGNIHTLYYDGSAVAIYNNAKNLFPSISNLYIGTSANLKNGYSGSIQDLKVYNRSLSSIDISNIINSYNNYFTPSNYLVIDPSFALWIDCSNSSNFTFSSSNIISGVKNISNNSGVMAIGGNANYAQYFANNSYTTTPFIQIGSYTNTPTSINTNITNINNKTELTFFWVVALDASFNDPSKNNGYYMPTLYGPDHYSVYANSFNLNNQTTSIIVGAAEMGATNNNNASNITMNRTDFSANTFQLISFKTSLQGTGQTVGFNGNYTTIATGFPGGGDTAFNVISSAPPFSNNSSPIYLKEVVGFTRSLPTTEFQQMEGYLAKKWRISNQLAINHPYYYS